MSAHKKSQMYGQQLLNNNNLSNVKSNKNSIKEPSLKFPKQEKKDENKKFRKTVNAKMLEEQMRKNS